MVQEQRWRAAAAELAALGRDVRMSRGGDVTPLVLVLAPTRELAVQVRLSRHNHAMAWLLHSHAMAWLLYMKQPRHGMVAA